MAITISSFSELAKSKIDTMVAEMAQLIQEQHPEVELTRDVFHDLVLHFNGLLNATIQENIDRVLQSKSLAQIISNPALSDPELVDQVLSNYNIVRDAGTPATGTITVIFNSPEQTELPLIGIYTANEVPFSLTDSFVVLPPDSIVTQPEVQRVMVPVGDGTYAANVSVYAMEIGVAGNVARGVTVTPNFIPNNVLSMYTAADFIGGKDASTNEQYVGKLAVGLAAKTIGGRKSYESLILAQPAFQNTLHISVLGCGDAEQQRDQHSLFPISGGGKVDIYAQTNSRAVETDHMLLATYVGDQTWQVVLSRDTAPGFYEVTRISLPADLASSGYAITSEIRSADLSDLAFIPDVRFLHESAYTRYQTAIVRFTDTDTPRAGLTAHTSKARYLVTTVGMPLIAELQDFLTSRDVRARGSDTLVKAAVPCFTKISFQIRVEAHAPITAEVELAMKRAIVKAVSAVGFSGQLHASLVTNAAQQFLTGRQAIGEIDMFGRIRRPDGTLTYVRGSEILAIAADNERLVTGRTVSFLVGINDISISCVAAGFTN